VSQFKPSPLCPRCGETDWAAFGVDRKRRLGLQIYCKVCQRAANNASHKKKADAKRASQVASAPDEKKWELVLRHGKLGAWRGHSMLAYEGNLSADQAMKFSEPSDCGIGAWEMQAIAGCFGPCDAEIREKFRFYRECR
jgi:hypothetical protein